MRRDFFPRHAAVEQLRCLLARALAAQLAVGAVDQTLFDTLLARLFLRAQPGDGRGGAGPITGNHGSQLLGEVIEVAGTRLAQLRLITDQQRMQTIEQLPVGVRDVVDVVGKNLCKPQCNRIGGKGGVRVPAAFAGAMIPKRAGKFGPINRAQDGLGGIGGEEIGGGVGLQCAVPDTRSGPCSVDRENRDRQRQPLEQIVRGTLL